jgi:hypothetical protein
MDKIKRERDAAMKKNAEDIEKVEAYKKMINNSQNNNNNNNNHNHNQNQNNKYEKKINDMMILIQELTKENGLLKDKVKQLENK